MAVALETTAVDGVMEDAWKAKRSGQRVAMDVVGWLAMDAQIVMLSGFSKEC